MGNSLNVQHTGTDELAYFLVQPLKSHVVKVYDNLEKCLFNGML